MTNEEAYNIISEYCFIGFEDNKKPSAKLFNAIRELVCEVHSNAELRDYNSRLENENTKLKAEIKQLQSRLEIKDNNFELYCNLIDERDLLQSENAKLCEENAELKKVISACNKISKEIIRLAESLKGGF